MTKILMLMGLISVIATPAAAISRYQSLTLSCDQARDILRSEGAAVLRYPSTRVKNLPLYDRYVRDSRFCDANQYAEWTRIPTKDNPGCRVLSCKPIPSRDDLPFWFVPNNAL